MAECVILIGLPGAGKTTFYRERFSTTHQHISKDLWPKAANLERRLRQELEHAFSAGRSVVVDNLNVSAAERASSIAIARAHGAHVVGYFFDLSTRAAVARNAQRNGRERVPNVAIFAAAKRQNVPSFDEGFDALFRVTLTPTHGATVDAIPRPAGRDEKT